MLTESLIQLGSDSTDSPNVDDSVWMNSAATKILADSVVVDMILLYTAEFGDINELIDDNWVVTSNWVSYKVYKLKSFSLQQWYSHIHFRDDSEAKKK